jgi:hypothetical protein
MHELAVAAELPYSGPWGKYQVAPAAESEPESESESDPSPSKTLVFATDTGITAALGLIRGLPFRPLLDQARVVWFVESPEYFLPEPWLERVIPPGCHTFALRTGPPVHDPARLAAARDALGEALEGGLPTRVFLSGDGAVLYPLARDLMDAGLAEPQIRLECFFNNPQRRAP